MVEVNLCSVVFNQEFSIWPGSNNSSNNNKNNNNVSHQLLSDIEWFIIIYIHISY